MQSRTGSFGLLGATVVVAGAGTVVFALFPSLQEEHGLSTASIGLVAAAGLVATLLAELLLAPLADRGRGRALLVTGAVGAAISLVLAGLATDATGLVLARVVGGASGGLFLPAVSAALIRSAPERSGELLGRLYAAELVGLAVGPLLATVLVGRIGPTAVLVGAGLLLLAFLPALVRASRAAGGSLPAAGHRPRLALDLLRSRHVVGAVLLSLAMYVPIGAYDAIWARFLVDMGGSELLLGLSFTLFAIPFVLVAAPSGRVADRLGGTRTAWIGAVVFLPMIATYALATSPVVLVGVGFVESTGQAFLATAASAAMAHAVPASRAGAAQGLGRAAGTLAAAVAALVAAPVYEQLGRTALFGATALAVLLLLVGASVAGTARPPRRRVEQPAAAAGSVPLVGCREAA